MELDLHKTIIPAKVPEKCNIDMIPEYKAESSQKAPRTASLFEQKSMKGWWPCYVEKDGSRILAVRLLLLLKNSSDMLTLLFKLQRKTGKSLPLSC